MLLSARPLKAVANVNTWEYDTQLSWTAGDQLTFYIQLVDMSLDKADQGFNPAGRRYMPAAGATLQVTLENIDNAKKITRLATQPFANDPSIWAVQIFSTDTISGTPQLRLLLTEAGVVTRGLSKCSIKIWPQANI